MSALLLPAGPPPVRHTSSPALRLAVRHSWRTRARQRRGRQRSEDGRVSQELADLVSDLEGSELPALEGDDLGTDPPGHRSGFVAVIGRPNAGKSTLINALLGQKLSSVTAKAQTTRHRIVSIISEPHYQMIVLDTPGVLKDRRNELDEKMMQNVRDARKDADVVLALVDASDRPEEGLDLLQLSNDRSSTLRLGVVLNKTDLVETSRVQELQSYFAASNLCETVLPAAAQSGAGVEEVKQWALTALPLGPTLYPKDDIADRPERFFVAEIIQEKIFQQYHDEIPYCTAVQVLNFTEREGHKDLIEVAVMVEAPSQRGIIIGKGGAALKRLGTAARMDIEAFLGRQVYLSISVKVQDKWRKDPKQVQRFGY